jgi:putative ABC transport system permease protein
VLLDLRYALRQLRNSVAFSIIAVTTLALAIGANAAMFSIVNGLMLSPLPYPEPDRIVRVLEQRPNGGLNSISTLNYLDWAAQNTVFEYMAAEAAWSATLTGGDEPIFIRGARASAHYFDVYRTQPSLGRTFAPDEDQPGNDRVVLLSHALWERRFGSDPDVVGRDVLLDGEPHVVIGVLEEDGPFNRAATEIWKPLAFEPSSMRRDIRWLSGNAKLKAGVTLEQAQAEMDLIGRRIADAHADSNEGWGVAVERLSDVLIGPDLRTAVTVLFAATACVLLIGCVNLVNLTLARSVARQSETAARAAVGATRWRLARQFLTEGIAIALCGSIVGVGVGFAMVKWIQSLIPAYTLPPAVDVGMDASVLVFTLFVAVVAGLSIGIAPAAQATNPNLVSTLKQGGHGATVGNSGRRLRAALVVAEIALAFVLLVASGLLMRSFFELLDTDPGFDPTNVLTAGLPIVQERHRDAAALNGYLVSLGDAIEAVPGVRATAITSALPLEGGGFGMPYAIADRDLPNQGFRGVAFFKMVSPSYFETLGISLVAGRVLSDDDTMGAPPVALINETLAMREFPDENPLGRRILAREIELGRNEFGDEIAWEIVGVIAGEKITGLGDEISSGIYVSTRQSPTYRINLVVRTDVPPLSLQRAIRAAVDSVNRDQALSDIRTLEQIVDRSVLANRFVSTLLTAFSLIALLLAAIGIYGVTSFSAAQRTHEMGIRAALGASAANLRTLIFLGGMRLTLLGLAIGLTGTFAVTRVMAFMLYGVGAHDPLTIAVVAAVLSGVAGLGCYVPARRITKADPMEALRYQ